MNVTITCGACKHEAPIEAFTNTVTGPLPNGEFQCPNCRRAIRLVKTPIEIFRGKVCSSPNKLVPIQSRL
jgi:hypothetical protein